MKNVARLTLLLLICVTLFSCQQERRQSVVVPKKALIEFNIRLARRDSAIIVAYSDSLGLNPSPNNSGLWLSMHDEGVGEKILKGQIVEFSYKVTDITGELYYEGVKKAVAAVGQEVSGVDETLLHLRAKSKATALLIPDKAYGIRGDDNKIRGRRILRYDIEILNVE